MHSGYDQVGPANHIATSEDLRVARLVGNDTHGFDEDATAVERVDGVLLEPRRRIRAKTEGDNYSVGRQDRFGPGNRFGTTTTVGARREPLWARTAGDGAVRAWIFVLACAELVGYRDGEEWFVSHSRFVKKDTP